MAWTTPGTAVAGDVLTAAFWNSNVRDNMNAIGTWTTWTPTLVGFTQGNGTLEGRYMQAGKTVAFRFYFKAGTTSTFAAVPFTFTLPVAANTASDYSQFGFNGVLHENGVQMIPGIGVMGFAAISTTVVEICYWLTGGAFAGLGQCYSAAPFGWGTGDKIVINGVYEAA
jgi:hypothetical protein